MTSMKLENLLRLALWVTGALLIVMIALGAGAWWVSLRLPVVNTVDIENVKILSDAELCPGEPVTYSYSFHARGTGVLVRDRVLWRVTPPPKTMVFSVSRRFIIAEPIDQELTEAWQVPRLYTNPETDKEETLPPGEYRLLFAVSSPSRSTVVDIDWVDFVIREDCGA